VDFASLLVVACTDAPALLSQARSAAIGYPAVSERISRFPDPDPSCINTDCSGCLLFNF